LEFAKKGFNFVDALGGNSRSLVLNRGVSEIKRFLSEVKCGIKRKKNLLV